MTRCAVLFALVFALVATTGCQQKPFTEFNSPDGKFKAIFPGEPKITSTAAAGVTIKMYAVESWSKSYMLAWSDVPIPEWESEGKTKSRLFDARDGAIAAVKGKSSGTTKVIQLEDRFPGVEFGGTAEGKYLRARAYIVGRRMYQLLVIARSQEDLTSTEAEDFFAAFQVFDAESLFPPGKPVPTAPEPEMFPVESNVGRFQANYPLRPTRFTRTVGGVHFTGYASESPNGSCSVAYADLPIPGGESPEKIRERLDTARNSALAEVKDTLAANKEVTIGSGRPGQEFTGTGEKHLRGRIYLIGARLYQVTTHGTEAFVTSKEATTFLDSFQLIAK